MAEALPQVPTPSLYIPTELYVDAAAVVDVAVTEAEFGGGGIGVSLWVVGVVVFGVVWGRVCRGTVFLGCPRAVVPMVPVD